MKKFIVLILTLIPLCMNAQIRNDIRPLTQSEDRALGTYNALRYTAAISTVGAIGSVIGIVVYQSEYAESIERNYSNSTAKQYRNLFISTTAAFAVTAISSLVISEIVIQPLRSKTDVVYVKTSLSGFVIEF